jgi:hypothetical protein
MPRERGAGSHRKRSRASAALPLAPYASLHFVREPLQRGRRSCSASTGFHRITDAGLRRTDCRRDLAAREQTPRCGRACAAGPFL